MFLAFLLSQSFQILANAATDYKCKPVQTLITFLIGHIYILSNALELSGNGESLVISSIKDYCYLHLKRLPYQLQLQGQLQGSSSLEAREEIWSIKFRTGKIISMREFWPGNSSAPNLRKRREFRQ